jgi:hypothetical protein
MRAVVIAVAIVGILVLPGVLAAALLLSGTVTVGDPMLDPAPAGSAASGEPSPAGQDPGATLEPDIARAIESRKLFGLRSDEAWVRQVAADPTARTFLLDFPMTPEEEREFEARNSSFEEVALAVQAYGEDHPDTFGGVWIDQQRHTVVTAWTRDAEFHRLAILAELRSFGPLEARTVAYSERQLMALQERIDIAWLRTLPAAFMYSSADIMENRVALGISSAVPDAEAQILAHMGVGPDMLHVESDGTGILLKERGTIHIAVVGPDGRGTGGFDWNVAWTPDRPGGGDCGEMVGIAIPEDGRFDLACAPGGWTIAIQQGGGDTGWTNIGAGHVVVPEGGDVDLEISVDS